MAGIVHRTALQVYRRLPTKARRLIVRTMSPSFTVGAMCIIERNDGAILFVRHSYRQRWGVPGGLLKRGEDVATGARREVREEVGLEIELVGEPTVVVDAAPQRVDVIFRARPADDADVAAVAPGSAEILDARWFPADALPELQFETAGALVTLARATRGGEGPRLPEPARPRLD